MKDKLSSYALFLIIAVAAVISSKSPVFIIMAIFAEIIYSRMQDLCTYCILSKEICTVDAEFKDTGGYKYCEEQRALEILAGW